MELPDPEEFFETAIVRARDIIEFACIAGEMPRLHGVETAACEAGIAAGITAAVDELVTRKMLKGT